MHQYVVTFDGTADVELDGSDLIPAGETLYRGFVAHCPEYSDQEVGFVAGACTAIDAMMKGYIKVTRVEIENKERSDDV